MGHECVGSEAGHRQSLLQREDMRGPHLRYDVDALRPPDQPGDHLVGPGGLGPAVNGDAQLRHGAGFGGKNLQFRHHDGHFARSHHHQTGQPLQCDRVVPTQVIQVGTRGDQDRINLLGSRGLGHGVETGPELRGIDVGAHARHCN